MTDARPEPVRSKDRIATLDVLRGLGVLGILAVNAQAFAAPIDAMFFPTAWPFPLEGASYWAWWVVSVFFTGKFVTLFSMLFGVSLFLVGGEREDDERGKVLRRRLFALLVFGLLHGALIWYGDILLTYAIAGFIVLLMRSWSARRLIIVGTAMLVAAGALGTLGIYFLEWAVGVGKASMADAQAGFPFTQDPAAVRADIETYTSGWAGAFSQNFADWSGLVVSFVLQSLWGTVALMLLGLGLYKSGFLSGRAPSFVYLLFVAAGAAALFLIGGVLSPPDGEAEHPISTAAVASQAITPLVTLGYASVLILLVRNGAGLLRPLQAAGQMAFTNYLTQSLIMTSIFYGGRGALMGEVDRPYLALIVVGVWALQLVWSPLWLAKFSMGPLEWVWRCLTYGRLVPIRRKAEADERFVTV